MVHLAPVAKDPPHPAPGRCALQMGAQLRTSAASTSARREIRSRTHHSPIRSG